MTQELDLATITASVIIVSILLSSAALWIRQIQRNKNELIPNAEAHPWNISWIDFLLFVCAQITLIVGVQAIGFQLLKEHLELAGAEITPGIAVAGVLMLQLPMLAVLFLLRRLVPSIYACQFNTQSYSLAGALKEAFPLFIMYLPIVWIGSYLWGAILTVTQKVGLIEAIQPQDLVQVFEKGGDNLSIGLLVFLAVVLAPIVEEIIFRGCVYRFLKSKTTFVLAQVLSGVIFSLMHPYLMSFVPLAIVGIILARIYEKSGNLLVPICFHAFFNGFTLLMLYIMNHSTTLP